MTSGGIFDLEGKLERISQIESEMASPSFWENTQKAQALVQERNELIRAVSPWQELSAKVEELRLLWELASEAGDEGVAAEIADGVQAVRETLEEFRLRSVLSGPEDPKNAIVSIHPGAGGTESQDWAQMLLRMYLRWAERHGFKAEVVDLLPGEEAGIKSATFTVVGEYAYGYLKGETGVHRLIRISPFDAAGRRQTSFAAVDVTPELDENFDIEIDWAKDVREETCRAGGAGGQHVNKTDSAIQLFHLPTGVYVRCQSERSQHKNRATARKMLIAKLFQMEQDKRDAEKASRRESKSKIGFGGEPIRHYVLHPESYVKDARSGLKTGNPNALLDGKLDPFLEAYLRWNLEQSSGKPNG